MKCIGIPKPKFWPPSISVRYQGIWSHAFFHAGGKTLLKIWEVWQEYFKQIRQCSIKQRSTHYTFPSDIRRTVIWSSKASQFWLPRDPTWEFINWKVNCTLSSSPSMLSTGCATLSSATHCLRQCIQQRHVKISPAQTTDKRKLKNSPHYHPPSLPPCSMRCNRNTSPWHPFRNRFSTWHAVSCRSSFSNADWGGFPDLSAISMEGLVSNINAFTASATISRWANCRR